jgi:hypothetical protein
VFLPIVCTLSATKLCSWAKYTRLRKILGRSQSIRRKKSGNTNLLAKTLSCCGIGFRLEDLGNNRIYGRVDRRKKKRE